MGRKISKAFGVALIVVLAGLAGTTARRFAFFVLPYGWTREPPRLARALGLEPGMHVADIGAGSGGLAVAMASLVGSEGQVFATELSPARRATIERRVRRNSIPNLTVVVAAETETRLPEQCCEAVYMRNVFHHIGDRTRFAVDVARALRPRGRVAVIDFAPGALWFLGAEHGVQPADVQRAFQSAGLRLGERVDGWGGGMYLIVFER